MNRTVIAVSLFLILGSLPASARDKIAEPATPALLTYERSGPVAEAALYTKGRTPDLGAAYALNMVLELAQSRSKDALATLAKYGPWLTSGGISSNSQQLIRAIQEAHIHGLNPEAYGESDILKTIDELSLLNTTRTSDTALAEFDPRVEYLRDELNQLLDKAFGQLITHHGQGLVDARATQRRLFRDVPAVSVDHYRQALASGQQSAHAALHEVKPQHADYRRLTQRMRNLLTEYASGVERTSVDESGNLWITHKHDDVLSIKRRLLEVGELPISTVLTPFFDADLLVALKSFQLRHGLVASGIVDFKTREALNTSIRDEIIAVSLSLERWRWMPRDLGDKHLYVNIPDYKVIMKEDEETTLSMIVVVGSTKHQTPSFTREMSYMEFNPTWTVPASITNNELIPKERRRPGYLASRQFDYLKHVNNRLVKVPNSRITKADLKKKRFPYVLRQRGGPFNGLGRLKFMMPNPYAIYLHDTLSKKHFALNDRAYSHGCIRLSDPDLMAHQLMKGDGYSDFEIRRALSTSKTKRVRLRSPIPTHLTYTTTWVDDTGILQQRPDVYKQDSALTLALHESNTLVTLMFIPASDAFVETLASS